MNIDDIKKLRPKSEIIDWDWFNDELKEKIRLFAQLANEFQAQASLYSKPCYSPNVPADFSLRDPSDWTKFLSYCFSSPCSEFKPK